MFHVVHASALRLSSVLSPVFSPVFNPVFSQRPDPNTCTVRHSYSFVCCRYSPPVEVFAEPTSDAPRIARSEDYVRSVMPELWHRLLKAPLAEPMKLPDLQK